MRGSVFLGSAFFVNESLGLFGVRHCVRQCCAVFRMDLCRFVDQHCFFNESLGFFWCQAFCKTVLCGFFVWFLNSVLLISIVFSMRVLVLLASGLFFQ